MIKDQYMNVFYNPDKANVVADDLSRMTMGSLSHVEEAKRDLLKKVHRLANLGVILEDFPNGGFTVHHNFESYFLAEVKPNKKLHQTIIELIE